MAFEYPFLNFDNSGGDGFSSVMRPPVLQPGVIGPAAPGSVSARDQPGPIRKQNHSCDQCRKGKRRCNAVVLRDWAVEDGEPSTVQSSPDGVREIRIPEPCGNCTRTKKTCTFEWLKSQEPALKARKDSSSTVGEQPPKPRSAKRAKVDKSDSNTGWQTSLSPADTFWSSDGTSPATLRSASSSSTGIPSGIGSLRQMHNDFSADLPAVEFPQDQFLFSEADCTAADYSIPTIGSFDISPPSSALVTLTNSSHQLNSGNGWGEGGGTDNLSDISYLFPRAKRPASPRIDASPSDEQDNEQTGDAPHLQFLFDPSPTSLPERLAKSANHTYLTGSLMRIYHDSMENALSCWLNERTCPYRLKALPNGTQSSDESLGLHREWGPDWSNRVFRRVFSLDQMAGKIRDRPLSKTEENAASKALYLVIMAFATQWAQASKRSREKHPPGMTADRSNSDASFTTGSDEIEFDRTIQEAYWREARRALLDCADIESFKVSFANIIFSLTQKPRSQMQFTSTRNRHNSNDNQAQPRTGGDFEGLLSDVESLIDEDGPPIYLEQGVRVVHSLRHKLQRREREMENPKTSKSGQSLILSAEDRSTVDLIAWLGYMLESLTSAMHQRPLVVSDEDCDVLPESIQALNLSDENNTEFVSAKPGASRLWNDYFFLQEKSNRQGARLRWPCSYDEAAAGLSDAAPIKVLLYRKVTLLQTLFARHGSADKIEDTIQDSLKIYDHWKLHYEPFIRDCINHHDGLPARVQSWYICLTGHWHLATLLLADIVSSIDTALLGLESHRRLRASVNLVATLRSYNSRMVSDLARCATPRADASFPQSKQFHFALNEGALLTEPWTAILIRVFAKSAILLMEEAWHGSKDANIRTSSRSGGGWVAEQAQQRAEDCVRALKYLGKKSDCAKIVGDTLGQALYENMTLGTDALEALNEAHLSWEAGFDDLFTQDDAFVADEAPFL